MKFICKLGFCDKSSFDEESLFLSKVIFHLSKSYISLLCNEVHCSCYASWTIPLETLVRCAATYKTKGFITLCTVAKKHEHRVPKIATLVSFQLCLQCRASLKPPRSPPLSWTSHVRSQFWPEFSPLLFSNIADDHTIHDLNLPISFFTLME